MFDIIAQMTKPQPIIDLLEFNIIDEELHAKYWRNNKLVTGVFTEGFLKEFYESDPRIAFESDNYIQGGEHHDYEVKMSFEAFLQRINDESEYTLEVINYFDK